MRKCITCSSNDDYDRIINSHNDRYALRLDPEHARIELYDMEPTPEVLLTDALVMHCPICGRKLGVDG